jgi:hypothetical protein
MQVVKPKGEVGTEGRLRLDVPVELCPARARHPSPSHPIPLFPLPCSLCENSFFMSFRGSRRRRGISRCLENTQSKIPRFARNDTPKEVNRQTPQGSGKRGRGVGVRGLV